MVVRSSSSPRVPLDSLAASARRRSRRSCPPSFRTMNAFAVWRNRSSSSNLRALLETLRIGDPIVVQVQRRGELIYLAFTLE